MTFGLIQTRLALAFTTMANEAAALERAGVLNLDKDTRKIVHRVLSNNINGIGRQRVFVPDRKKDRKQLTLKRADMLSQLAAGQARMQLKAETAVVRMGQIADQMEGSNA